jgi:hypothetical protein
MHTFFIQFFSTYKYRKLTSANYFCIETTMFLPEVIEVNKKNDFLKICVHFYLILNDCMLSYRWRSATWRHVKKYILTMRNKILTLNNCPVWIIAHGRLSGWADLQQIPVVGIEVWLMGNSTFLYTNVGFILCGVNFI